MENNTHNQCVQRPASAARLLRSNCRATSLPLTHTVRYIILKKELNNLMIGRIWHGWTKTEYADKYEQILKEKIIPGIAAKKLAGYRAFQLLRRPLENEIEFITIMWFDSWDAVKQFAGEDYEKAYVPPIAREVLERFDERSQHYEIKELLEY